MIELVAAWKHTTMHCLGMHFKQLATTELNYTHTYYMHQDNVKPIVVGDTFTLMID